MPILECDVHRIRTYLESASNELEDHSFLEHLSQCRACQDLMERIAGSKDDWAKAKELLAIGPEVYPSAANSERDPSKLALDIASLIQLNPTDDPYRLGRIGSFEIISVIGRGGMGIVMKAFDPALHRTVAIKILDPIVARLESSRRRFARESRAMAAIAHEHIVPVYAVDEHRELPYIVMEYVPGGTLEHRLAAGLPMDVVEMVRTALQIAKGLAAAHRVGVIHRDIKPSNILLDTGTERMRVADFGLAREIDDAKQTHSQTIIGTPLFMSPEQVRGEVCDARSDLFSLGSLLFTLCTGKPPFQADSVYATMQRIANDNPTPILKIRSELPFWFGAMVHRLLEKEREARFQSADELCEALESELAALQSPQTCEQPRRLWLRTDARRRSKTATGWMAALGVALLVAVFLFQSLRPNRSNEIDEFPSSFAATIQNTDDDAEDPTIANWVKLLIEAPGHNPIAFNLGPRMLQEQPEKSVAIAEAAWPKMRDRLQKTAILKVFRFGEHNDVLRILHLGMTDADPDVRKYADSYLTEYTFRSYDGEAETYLKWHSAHQGMSGTEVLEENYRILANELRRLGPDQGIEKWSQHQSSNMKWEKATTAIKQSGIAELFVEWFESSSVTPPQKKSLLEFFRKVPLERNTAESLFTELAVATPIKELTFPAIQALIASDPSRAFGLLSKFMDRVARQGKLTVGNNGLWDLAQSISETGDDRFIPYLIGLIDADNSYDTIYGTGYFGLGFSAMGKLTQVTYSPFHDGKWWRNWWERNRERFSEQARVIQIPDYPKTAAGKKYKPIEQDIETHEGRVALTKQMMDRKQFDKASDIAKLFVLHNDQEAIPLLIGIIEADNSYDTVYGVGYFGLRSLIKPLKVRYSSYHDGAWWRRWWDRNKSNFSEAVQANEIPIFAKSKFGRSYVSMPAELDHHVGRVEFVRKALAKRTIPDIEKLCDVFDLANDPRDFAAMIGLMAFFDGKPEAKAIQSEMDRQKFDLGIQAFPQSLVGWREWWQEHRSDWPDTADLEIYDFKTAAVAPVANPKTMNPSNATRRKTSESDDIENVPSKLMTIDGQKRMQYFWIGNKLTETPLEQRKLLVVLPGGDGGKDFEPFVRRIWKYSLDESWNIAQLVSVSWFQGQEVVWPTKHDIATQYAKEPIDFTTESFIDQVIEDVGKSTKFLPSQVVVFGWSSSGPAIYSHSLIEEKRASKAYVAMSIFKPDRLPELLHAKDSRYVIDHSPQDRVCPFRYAQQARTQLESAGARVHSLDYQGGHGWHDNPLERIHSGLAWLIEK